MIPSYIRSLNGSNYKSVELFGKLATKLVFFDAYFTNYVPFLKGILTLGNLTVNNTSINTANTYAIMDNTEKVDIFSALLKSNGSRLVLDAKEGIPLITIVVGQTLRNWIYPIIMRRLGHLKASGIEGVWAKLENAYQLAYTQRIMGYRSHEIYFFASHKFAARQSVVLNGERAIKLKPVQPVFVLTLFLFLISLINFMVEIREKCIPSVVGLKVYLWGRMEPHISHVAFRNMHEPRQYRKSCYQCFALRRFA